MMSPPSPTMSESRAELRKSNKPLMEKRRRARINASLIQLKSLVLEALKKDTSRYSKLEKADILDMTVKHLKSIHRQQMSVAMTNDPSVIGKYRAGFNECAKEVARYMTTVSGVEPDTRTHLLSHLANCLHQQSMTQPQQMPQQTLQPLRIQIPQVGQGQQRDVMKGANPAGPAFVVPSQDFPNVGAVQLVPGTLPTGEVAFFVPNQGQQNPQGQFAMHTGVAPSSLPVSYPGQSHLVQTPPAGSEAPSTSSSPDHLRQSPASLTSDIHRSPVHFRERYQPYAVAKTDNSVPLNLAVHEPVAIKREDPVWRPW